MITCPTCNNQLEDGTKFCSYCGKQIVTTVFCQNCGTPSSTEFAFCQNCGTPLTTDPVPAVNKKEAPAPKPRSKFPKKLVIIGSSCIALILVVAIVLSTLLHGKEEINFALYLKNNELYYTDISNLEPWQVTTHLIDDKNIKTEDLVDSAYSLGYYTHLSSDGKILFYVDKVSEDSDGASLFYRYVNKPQQEPYKIDSDIVSYSVSEDGKLVTYLKGEDGALYQHDLTNKEKIDSEVSAFEVSDDGNKIGWLSREGGLYLKYANEDEEKLDSDVTQISYVNEAFDTVYYIKEGTLYKMIEGQDKEKIDSEVSSVIKVYESGEIYYLKSDSEESSLLDYVEDDMKKTDNAIAEPVSPDYPDYWDYYFYDDYDAYYDAIDEYEEDYAKYEKDLDAWYAKKDRDELREELSEKTIENSAYTLFYYDGTNEEVLTEAFAKSEYSSGYTTASDNPVIVYSVYNQDSMKKIKLSDIEDASDVEDMVKEALNSSSDKHVAVKGESSIIEQTEAKHFNITSDGKTIYFSDNISEETYHGDIYKISISGDEAQKPELYDSDVYSSYTYLTSNDKFIYYKDVKDSKGELYLDKQMIDYDVYIYSFSHLDESDTTIYLVDWNDEKQYGTLKMFKDGEITKIADDVHTYETTPNGEILYLYDYSTTYFNGELFIYKNNKAEKIDDDVSAIIPIYDLKYRGNTYW